MNASDQVAPSLSSSPALPSSSLIVVLHICSFFIALYYCSVLFSSLLRCHSDSSLHTLFMLDLSHPASISLSICTSYIALLWCYSRPCFHLLPSHLDWVWAGAMVLCLFCRVAVFANEPPYGWIISGVGSIKTNADQNNMTENIIFCVAVLFWLPKRIHFGVHGCDTTCATLLQIRTSAGGLR